MKAVLDVYEELQTITRALDRGGVAHALIGGIAVSIYARPRATEDIDVLLRSEDMDRCAGLLAPAGYRLLPSAFHFPQAGLTMRRFTKLAASDFMVLDVLLASTPALLDMLARRTRVESGAGGTWLVPLDALRELKRLRGSAQDLADLAALEAPEEET